ncbi:hypothetical protein M569_02481, partial [Genlisea aurea]
MDAKDILGLPKNTLPIQEKKSRPSRESQRKPDGVSREVYALTGGLPPLMPAVDPSQLKRKTQAENEKITWQWLPFSNSARKDDLQLYHWVRVVNGVPPTGDYSFAKYNKSVDVIKYTDEEYEKYLADPNWTKEETDQLFDLCQRFDLRFIVVADRFPSTKSVEELKDRYYTVARAILIARAPSPNDISGHPLVKMKYNASQETERKRALNLVLSHTKQQERKDVEASREQPELPASVDKEPFAANTINPSSNPQLPFVPGSNPVSETASVLASLRMLHVYLRSYAHVQMVEAVSSSAAIRTIKRVEQTLQDLRLNLKPKIPTKAVCAEHLELRKDILILLDLQRQVRF